MTPTPQQLRDAHCWFRGDRAPGDTDMTAFKREARYRQHQWAVRQGITEFGGHTNTKRGIAAGGPATIPNGTKLTEADAAAGRNFLSAAVLEQVNKRLRQPQHDQTLDPNRLQRDLLSSMPMAFNLFGEACSHPQSKEALTRLLAPGVAVNADSTEIVFEWSPDRRSPEYTRDRTAFDVAILIGPDTGPRAVVGVETKYHEDARPDRAPSEEQQRFLEALAEDSGAFVTGWRNAIEGTPLRQIWRDHLLALSLRQHPQRWTAASRYVLIYPARNTSYANLAREYALQLAVPESFSGVPLEDVVAAAYAHDPAAGRRFRERYLW